MIVKVPKYMYENGYYWFILRCFYFLQKDRKIELEKTDDKFLYTHYISTIFIDNQPIIIDVRDDSALPLPEIKKYPNALIFKANYSSELWDNPPKEYEYKITDEERKYRNQIRQFVYGRSIILPLDTDEVTFFKEDIQPINYDIVSLSGPGVYTLQTKSRLDVYDLMKDVFKEKSKLIWYDRNHFTDKANFPDYARRIQNYAYTSGNFWGNYNNYIQFLSQGKFSINFPGIACSQPFRLIDGVLANRCTISTKIWIDAHKDFPTFHIPICGYFGTGISPKDCFNNITDNLYNEYLSKSKEWYLSKLSVNGMWSQIIKGLNE